jgi:hypothetical protein
MQSGRSALLTGIAAGAGALGAQICTGSKCGVRPCDFC